MFSESDPLAQLSLSEMSPPVEAVNPDSVGGLGDIQGRLTRAGSTICWTWITGLQNIIRLLGRLVTDQLVQISLLHLINTRNSISTKINTFALSFYLLYIIKKYIN